MDLRDHPAGIYARILAMVSLALGLVDATRVLGWGQGAASPVLALGLEGFAVLMVLCLSRLFAAVGLWMQTRWGALLLVAATGVELVLYAARNALVQTGLIGFVFKVLVVAATMLLLAWVHFRTRRRGLD